MIGMIANRLFAGLSYIQPPRVRRYRHYIMYIYILYTHDIYLIKYIRVEWRLWRGRVKVGMKKKRKRIRGDRVVRWTGVLGFDMSYTRVASDCEDKSKFTFSKSIFTASCDHHYTQTGRLDYYLRRLVFAVMFPSIKRPIRLHFYTFCKSTLAIITIIYQRIKNNFRLD